jgi:hypothetical protein
VKWFGEPWPSADCRAPVCEDDADRVPPPPPGEECLLCGEGFAPDAQGVRMPHLMADRHAEDRYTHIQCLIKNVGWH